MYSHFSLSTFVHFFVNFTKLYNVRCISFFVHYVYFDYLVHLVSLVFVIHVTFPFAHFHMLSILSLCTPSILFRLLDDRLQFLHYLLKVPPFGWILLPTLQHQAVAGLRRVIRGLHSVPLMVYDNLLKNTYMHVNFVNRCITCFKSKVKYNYLKKILQFLSLD